MLLKLKKRLGFEQINLIFHENSVCLYHQSEHNNFVFGIHLSSTARPGRMFQPSSDRITITQGKIY
jgi:hypothetical protein